MAEYISEFAPENLPDIIYTRVNQDMLDCILRTAPNVEGFGEITIMPTSTPEEIQATATEWAGYDQAKGNVEAKERGAIFIANSRDESPEAYARMIKELPGWVVIKIVRTDPDVSDYELLRDYYEPRK